MKIPKLVSEVELFFDTNNIMYRTKHVTVLSVKLNTVNLPHRLYHAITCKTEKEKLIKMLKENCLYCLYSYIQI